MASRRTGRLGWRLTVALVTAVISACGTASPAPRGPAGATPAAKVPDPLIAAKLLTPSNLGAAGLSVTGVEDDGGAQQQPGAFISRALTGTVAGAFTIDLTTYDSKTSAQQAYQAATRGAAQSSPSPQSISGVGDQATHVGDNVVALKGAQVVNVQSMLSAAAELRLEQAKSSATDFYRVQDEVSLPLRKDAQSIAKALGAAMSGQKVTGNPTYVPAGAADPCIARVATLKSKSKAPQITSGPVLSDGHPALQCVYTFGTPELAVYTLTDSQARSALPPTTVEAYFSSITVTSGRRGRSQYGKATAGPFQAVGATSGEPDFAVMYTPAKASAAGLVIRIRDQRSSYVVDARHCADEIEAMADEVLRSSLVHLYNLGPEAEKAARDQIESAIYDWCKMEAQPGETPPAQP